MDLSELTDEERRALVALVHHVVRADGQLTDEEIDALSEVAEEMGQDAWREAFREVSLLSRSRDEVMKLAATIERQETRSLATQVLERVAGADGFDRTERAVIKAMQELWAS